MYCNGISEFWCRTSVAYIQRTDSQKYTKFTFAGRSQTFRSAKKGPLQSLPDSNFLSLSDDRQDIYKIRLGDHQPVVIYMTAAAGAYITGSYRCSVCSVFLWFLSIFLACRSRLLMSCQSSGAAAGVSLAPLLRTCVCLSVCRTDFISTDWWRRQILRSMCDFVSYTRDWRTRSLHCRRPSVFYVSYSTVLHSGVSGPCPLLSASRQLSWSQLHGDRKACTYWTEASLTTLTKAATTSK